MFQIYRNYKSKFIIFLNYYFFRNLKEVLLDNIIVQSVGGEFIDNF